MSPPIASLFSGLWSWWWEKCCNQDFSVAWTALGSLATALGVFIVFLAKGDLKFNAWLKAQELWTDKEAVKERGRVFRRMEDPYLPWPPEEKEAALQVARKIDEFVRLAPYVGRCRLVKTWADPIAKAWLILKPLVLEERTVSKWDTKWDAFERYGKRSIKHRPEVKERYEAARAARAPLA
jgi:hypothetical protein